MRKRDKLDGVDVDHIDQTIQSPGWQLIRQRLERSLGVKRMELERDVDPVSTAKIRGEIAGMKLALEIPGILMQEGKDGAKNT